MTIVWVTRKKKNYHLSFYPSGGVLLGAFPAGSDSRYEYTASSRRLEIHSKIISVEDQGSEYPSSITVDE
jgi:YD repeat-containing protein